MRSAALLSLLVIPQMLAACECAVSRSVCQSVAASNLVFIGTVDAIEPSMLDRLKSSSSRDWMRSPEIVKLQRDKSQSGLRELKDRYLKLLLDLPDGERLRIESAGTQQELQKQVNWIQSHGIRARFRVQTVFQNKTDDDPDSDKKDSSKEDQSNKKVIKVESADVWTQLDDCGILFQKGETYLVYADDDEEDGRLETNVCMGTTRLSDAGEDLAYLHFFQNGGAKSTRLEGFVTSSFDQLILDPFHYSGKIKSPVSKVVAELRSGDDTRYSEPDQNGRFIFDGLAEGDYQVSIFEGGFPDVVEKLSGPKRVHLQAGRCNVTTVLVLHRKAAH